MTWNPFQYQFSVNYLRDEGSKAVLEIRKGATVEEILFPKIMLPPEAQPGSELNMELKDPDSAKQNEISTLKKLLEELVK